MANLFHIIADRMWVGSNGFVGDLVEQVAAALGLGRSGKIIGNDLLKRLGR